jgi:transposase
MAVAPWIVLDALWERIEPLLPKAARRFRYPGRRGRLIGRHCKDLVRAAYRDRVAASAARAWLRLRLDLLPAFGRVAEGGRVAKAARAASERAAYSGRTRLGARGRRLQPRASEKGDSATGPSPVDRARNGSKHHLLVDATGIPLAWTVTGGNRNDVTQLISPIDRVPPVRGRVGRPRRRPERLTADRGYDHDTYRRQLRRRGITPEIARRQTDHGSGLGSVRWVVERTFAWPHHRKRLLVRYDRRHEIHEAFLTLACCLVCFRRLQNSF